MRITPSSFCFSAPCRVSTNASLSPPPSSSAVATPATTTTTPPLPSSPPCRRRRPQQLLMTRLLIATLAVITTSSLSLCDAAFPAIDFEALGSVGVAGSFAGLDIWDSSVSTAANSYDAAASTILQRSSNGTVTQLNATEAGGVVSAMCGQPTGSGTIIAAGSFSRMGEVSTSNIAAYHPSTGRWDSMSGGIDGTVSAVLCLDDMVVVGGEFTGPTGVAATALKSEGYQGNVAAWNFTSGAWQAIDFGGLNGTVHTIIPGANASMVQFGGAFDTAFGNSSNPAASSALNATAISGTLTSSTALSAKWAPVSMAMSFFQGGPTHNDGNFNMFPQILCPQGEDGPGNTYLFADGSAGSMSVSLLRRERIRAFRLGNTFYNGRGTQNFSISLVDGTELELLYLDPSTNRNVTCTSQCQLDHTGSVPYQDFLINDGPSGAAIDGTRSITGFSFNVKSWHGAGAGLHMLALLSPGSSSSAYRSYNRGACDSPVVGVNGSGSDITFSGGWYTSTLATDIGGVREGVLQLSDSYSNLGSYSDAQISFQVDTAVRGNYTAYLHVPGCARAGQCDQRTDVLVTVINNSTNSGTSITVSQNVQEDTDIPIWDGEIDATTQSFMPSVVLSVPSGATQPSSGNFVVVADRVRFVLRNSINIYQANVSAVQRGFGVFSYNILDAEQRALTTIDATAIVPNASLTDLDAFGITLLSAGTTRESDEQVYALATIGQWTFVGGSFSSNDFSAQTGFQNVVAYDNRQNVSETVVYSRLGNGGLDGTVRAMSTMQDNFLFVGGEFTNTADRSAELAYLARYNPLTDEWAALANGPNGPVSSLALLGVDGLLVAGNFTELGNSTRVPGYAVWNETTLSWGTESSYVIGSISSVNVVNGTAYMVGSVAAVSGSSAPGAAGLDAPESGTLPLVTALNFAFADDDSASSSSARRRSISLTQTSGLNPRTEPKSLSSRKARRTHSAKRPRRRSFLRSLFANVFRRQDDGSASGTATSQGDAIQAPSLQDNSDSQVLASAFWERSDGTAFTIIGGRFSTSSGINNLGIYDQSSRTLEAFSAYPSENGSLPTVFRALAVVDDILYAGGDGGLVVYDMGNATWISSGQELASTSGNNLTISAIAHRPNQMDIVVAGSFDVAGMLPCQNVCLWDTSSHRWNVLGNGVEGQITAIDYAGTSASDLIVAGQMTVNGESAAMQKWDFDAQNWTAIGSVGTTEGQAPGPATALVVNDLNLDSIFIAGRYADGSAPYLAKWDGSQYELLGSDELEASSGVAQLTLVPITEAHPSNDILENNRLLVVSGALNLTSYGNVSSAFFDGVTWNPFLRTTSTSGGSGIVRALSRSTEVLKFPNLHHLAIGLVILISIAIGLGIVFLLVLIGLLVALARRRPDAGVDVPISPSDEALAHEKKRPTSLLATLNAATENVMGGGAGGAAGLAAMTTTAGGTSSSGHGHYRGESVPLTSEGHGYVDPSSQYHSEAQTGRSDYYSDDVSTEAHHTTMSFGTSAAAGAAAAATATAASRGGGARTTSEDNEGVDAHMRFSFEATHPSELGARAGDSVTILDDADEHWWLARSEDGRIGVVPASYVL